MELNVLRLNNYYERINRKQQKLSFVSKLISDDVVEPEELISQVDDYDTSE